MVGLSRTGRILRMLLRCGGGDQLEVELLWQARIPVAGKFGVADEPEEDDRDAGGHGPSWYRALARRRDVQRVLRWTYGDALQASGAFGRADLHQLVHGKRRRTSLRALGAVDAGQLAAGNAQWADERGKSQECSVGTEIPAPEVLDEDGR